MLLDSLEDHWGGAEAIYLLSPLPRARLRHHLRKLTLVEMPGKGAVYFRFYDPRVLREVLPVFDDAQRAQFFGDAVAEAICEDRDGGLARFAP